jgi:cytochrome c
MRNLMKEIAVIATLTLCSASTFATDLPKLAAQKNCGACHAMDKKIVGPAWTKVARRYKGDGEAIQFLTNKIKKGGAGVWGSMPMPAQSVTREEATAFAEYILELNNQSYAAK